MHSIKSRYDSLIFQALFPPARHESKREVNLRRFFNRIAQNIEYSECFSALG
ncbi:hypothetical protein vfu_A00578 [Vibrio furnissii NCTC 11218]|nr:hypothetical protein vfu_A00578 [Vibrio furnissii NCTC 11218]